MFTLLGTAVSAYVVLAVWRGEVFARRHAWGERIWRDDEPQRFWTVIAIDAGLAVALVTVF
jgi:hypothetical protein